MPGVDVREREKRRISHNLWKEKNRERRRAQQSAWYRRNAARVSAKNKAIGAERVMANRAYYDKHPDKLFARSLKYQHGMTVREYEHLHKSQNGKCAICGDVDSRAQDPKALKGLLHVDHCHKTKIIRGLLCKMCNLMIGLGKDKPEVLISGAAYLKERGGSDS